MLIQHLNAPPSPKQKQLFVKKSGITLPTLIVTRWGANLAIRCLLETINAVTVEEILLIGECFGRQFTADLKPTFMPEGFENGKTLGQLLAMGLCSRMSNVQATTNSPVKPAVNPAAPTATPAPPTDADRFGKGFDKVLKIRRAQPIE